jgi:3-oxoadipate enol-lactonase
MNFKNINKISVHYEYIDNQRDRTFVFINSLGTDFRIWDGVVKVLKNHGNILRYDKAGHGLSGIRKLEGGTPSEISAYVSDLIGLMDELHIEKAIIVGLSIGGIIAQYMGIYHPERVEKLVLSNTAPKVGSEDSWNTRINVVENKGIAAIADTVMKVWFSVSFHQQNPNELNGYKMMLSNSNVMGYLQACEALKSNDLTNKIKQINRPTLCIGGGVDGSTPSELVKAMADKIPNSIYILIDGVGHIPCVEVPDTVANHILNFVK